MEYFSTYKVRTLLVLLVVLPFLVSCVQRDRYIVFSGYAQGGTYTVKLNLNGPEGRVSVSPETIRDSVDAILQNVDASLSGYNKKSLLSRFNKGETIVPDTLFLDIYTKAYEVYEGTGHIVDAASAPLFDIWGFGFKSGDMPTDDQVALTLKGCGMDRLVYDVRSAVGQDGTLKPSSLLKSPSDVLPSLNYNAIAQGYSCDLVAEYLYSLGVKDMMVDIGEIFCDGVNPSGQPWGIGIDRPADGNNELGADVQAVFRVPSGPHGIVTSGNYRKFYVRDGKKHAHTIDPVSGYPVSHNLLSATILANDALTADAYATYCMVIGLDKSVEFITSTPEIEGCLVYDQDGEFRVWTSPGMTVTEL